MREPRKYSFMIWGFAPPISEAPIEYFRDLKLPDLPATRAAVIRATNRFSGGSMQDQSTTGINEGASGKIADKNLGDIGPFTNSEIESVTRKCVADLGLNWENLSARAKSQYIEVTRNALGIMPNGEHLNGLIGGTSRGMKEFQNSVLTEFRNSPKWDEDLFISGWKVADPGTISGIGSEGGADTTGG